MDKTNSMLPTEVVVKILQHVPQQPRFNTCALVCRSWHTAAVAATNNLTAQLSQQEQLDCLGLWLQRQGARLQALSISSIQHSEDNIHNNSITLHFLQLQHLLSLELESLALTPSSHLCAPLLGLNSLQLNDAHLQCDDYIRLLSQLTSLKHLKLSSKLWATHIDTDFEDIVQWGLGAWKQLTSLVLDIPMYDDSVLKGLGDLTQLQQLKITNNIQLSTGTRNSLPLSLQRLDFSVGNMRLGPNSTPRISELTRLQQLTIWGNDTRAFILSETAFDPQLLRNLVQLQHLDLQDCPMKGEADVVAVLKVLPRLQQLQHLSLTGSLRESTEAERYRALVSSTRLTALYLTDCSLPHHAVYHVFSAEQQYPALETFHVGNLVYGPADHEGMNWAVCEGALDRLVSHCPNLKQLRLADAIEPALTDISALAQLTGLSKLTVGGGWVSDVSVAGLVELKPPALHDLEVVSFCLAPDSHCTAQGIVCLCFMTHLTRLLVDGEELCEKFQSEAGLTDLWQRMYSAFSSNKPMAEALVKERNRELAAALQRASAAEQQVQDLQQQLQLARKEVETLAAAMQQQQQQQLQQHLVESV